MKPYKMTPLKSHASFLVQSMVRFEGFLALLPFSKNVLRYPFLVVHFNMMVETGIDNVTLNHCPTFQRSHTHTHKNRSLMAHF